MYGITIVLDEYELLASIKDLQVIQNLTEAKIEIYQTIRRVLMQEGFECIHDGFYRNNDENMLSVTKAMSALRSHIGDTLCIKSVHVFKVSQWSDFTSFINQI
ncbi:hypothetical protein [Moraxella sp. ZY210820]|uniref:hypothetical protein n=1 Tax=unclassified Moraxella TaxID=2685852 RepID=UPI0027313502|nr:hypothetical protein [Moraxella sp. ZY210820]WLF82907.1 hypothetical protein LU301_06335 [Moraxella sp. ZY210820]